MTPLAICIRRVPENREKISLFLTLDPKQAFSLSYNHFSRKNVSSAVIVKTVSMA
jgi:hypothetical protein